VLWESELFPPFGSGGLEEETLTLLTRVLAAAGAVTVIVMVKDDEAATVPELHVTDGAKKLRTQVDAAAGLTLAPTNVTLPGRLSVTVTLFASLGPLFLTLML
jgi:hypothetical protein